MEEYRIEKWMNFIIVLIRLYVPHDELEVEALRKKILEVYGAQLPRFFRLGIKQPDGLPTNEGWYWGSGEFNQIEPFIRMYYSHYEQESQTLALLLFIFLLC